MTDETWLEPEERCYPSGGMRRKARARLVQNSYRTDDLGLPYGRLIIVRAGIPDTYFSIPARYRYRGRVIRGFLSRSEGEELTFTPERYQKWEGRPDGTEL